MSVSEIFNCFAARGFITTTLWKMDYYLFALQLLLSLNNKMPNLNLLIFCFSSVYTPLFTYCTTYSCEHKLVPINNATTVAPPTPPTPPPPTPSPIGPAGPGIYFILAMVFIALFLLACSFFAAYCVVRQYLWQRSNRQQQTASGLPPSPNERTPIIRHSSNIDLITDQAAVENLGQNHSIPLTTFRPAYNLRSRQSASYQTLLPSFDFKSVTLIADLEPFLPEFQPKDSDHNDCLRFLQRLQIFVACHTLKVEKATKAIHEHGRVLNLMSTDPNTESCTVFLNMACCD